MRKRKVKRDSLEDEGLDDDMGIDTDEPTDEEYLAMGGYSGGECHLNFPSSPEPPAGPQTVEFAEAALKLLTSEESPLTPEGKEKTVYQLLRQLADEVLLGEPSFIVYVIRIQEAAPEAFAASARGLLEKGMLLDTMCTVDGSAERRLPRYVQIIRFFLLKDLGLERPEDIVLLETAIFAWVQGCQLHRSATNLFDYSLSSPRKQQMLKQAGIQQRLFLRSMEILRRTRKSPAQVGRPVPLPAITAVKVETINEPPDEGTVSTAEQAAATGGFL